MSSSSSRWLDPLCSNLRLFGNASSSYNQVTLTTCVVTSLLAPMTVVANGLILAAIWKKPSLRTPSYVLLAGLAFTHFCTGLLTQPFYTVYKLADVKGNKKIFCIAGAVAESVGLYFSSLTFIVMTIMAVERWLHMSRRSLLTVRRVVIIYITCIVFAAFGVAARMYVGEKNRGEIYKIMKAVFLLGAGVCVVVTAFSYLKVFRIIRQHQCLVQTNENAIDIAKYKKSIFTILYIFAIFVLSYIPYLCCILVFLAMQHGRSLSSMTAFNACAVIMFSSSFFNPLLYYWRIKEIRDSVKNIVKKLSCKKAGTEES